MIIFILFDKRERGKYVPEQVIAADFAMRLRTTNSECFARATISCRADFAIILKRLNWKKV